MKRLSLVLLCGLAVTAVAACGGGAPPPTPTPAAPAVDSAALQRAAQDSIERARQDSIRRAQEEADRIARQRTADSLAAIGKTADAVRTILTTMIHFDFDKALIRSEDASVLDQKVAILRANANLRIRISGHCDERGSAEYNLALGNRRATSSKQYLVSHGVEAARIETVSYGEERPMAQGHDETAWAQNRRDEFEIIGGGDNLKQP
jgi:peptidoglycan-associated lipoprotein